ncbi:copper-binding protein [Kosakonia sp. SOY2]|uniref:copper-binding protein n=1 Tax=Kosakonia sp. SOY2 TaxID=3014557 RepID=UPI0022AC74D5|nr:copper-binding protein [Kosakonia sp. SOY2]MCZ3382741.1 copper-binding protein [Kosakonia sp. SOY2]
MPSSLLCMLSGVLFFSLAAYAEDMPAMHDMSSHGAMHAQAPTYQSQGVIKKITPDAISIAHHAIPALNWPPMTMQFALAKGSTFAPVNVGDKVEFSFVQSENGYQLVSLTPQR